MAQKDHNKSALKDPKPPAPPVAAPLTPPAAPPLTPAEIENLRSRAAKADEHWDRLLRTTADFENFKKRAARERHEAIKFANETLIQKLLPVLDHFDLALAAARDSQANAAPSLQAGVTLIHQQLQSVLTEAGLEEVQASGKPFDPHVHEAVSQEETADLPDGQVVQQLRKGYQLRGRLLRPAAVVVAKTPTPKEPAVPPKD